MKIRSRCFSRYPFALGAAVAAIVFVASPARAFRFTSGELKGSFDSTFSVGGLYRLHDPEAGFYGTSNSFDGVPGAQHSVNADDGNLNYGQGWASLLFKGSHDLELRYRNFGAFVRGYYFYDAEAAETRRTPLSAEARSKVFRGGELLDAYVLAKFSVGAGLPVDVRLGRQVLSLGESTFLPNGINVINPVDLSKLRTPGSELKEALLPVFMLKGSIGVTPNITIEPFWMLQWRHNEIEPAGSYFSTTDIASRGGRRVYLGFGSLPDTGSLGVVPRADDRDADALNQYGLAVHVQAPGLNDTDFGFYYARYNSRSPVISAVTPTGPIDVAFVRTTAGQLAQQNLAPAMLQAGFPPAGIPAALTTLLGAAFTGVPGSALPPALQPFYPGAQSIVSGAGRLGLLSAASTARYFLEYPENLDMLGASFNTSVGNTGISWQGEVSFKHDVPLQVDDAELLFAALSTLNPAFGASNQVGNFPGQFSREIPGYRRHDVWTAQTTLTKVFGPLLGSQQFTLVGEIGGIRADLPAQSTLRYEGPGSFASGSADAMSATGFGAIPAESAAGFADTFSWGYQILGRLDYTSVFAGVNVAPSIGFTHDVHGTTPMPLGNFIQDRKSVTVAAEFVFQNAWVFELRYVNFFGGGRYNLLSDRDFVATTLKYSF